MESLLLMVAMIAVFYFLIIRPENKRKKQAEQMRSSLKKGDRVTTIGGMVGKIVQVNDSTIVFETSEDRVRIEVTKWAVQSPAQWSRPPHRRAARRLTRSKKRRRRLLLSRRKRLRRSRLLLRKKSPPTIPRSSKSYPDAKAPAKWSALFCALFSRAWI